MTKNENTIQKKPRLDENKSGSFSCVHCRTVVWEISEMGTSHRNHCNVCLWSKHVDEASPGDRKSTCCRGMKPIGVTLKHEGVDKFTGQNKLGDIMLVHLCTGCDDVRINRIASDDNTDAIMEVFEQSENLSEKTRKEVALSGIEIYGEDKRSLIEKRLFGAQGV